MDLVKQHKRLRDEDEEDASDCEDYGLVRPQKIRATSMAKIMNLTQHDLEMLHFYVEHSGPILVEVTGEKDSNWMGAAPQMSMRSSALAQACQVFAEAHKFYYKNPYRYLLQGEKPHPKSKGKPNMGDVIGYVPMALPQLERLIVGFTEALRALRLEIENLDETSNYDSVFTATVIISICAIGASSFVPLINFDGHGDLFSILRILNDIQANYNSNMGGVPIGVLHHQVPLPGRLRLPHEDELRDIVNLVPGNDAEGRRVRSILHREIHTLIEMYNLDVEGKSVAHIVGWCVYWQPEFAELKEEENVYALLVICFWCAYVHRYHALFWWGDRLQEDLYSIVDRLPRELIRYVEWPLRAVTNFEYDHLDWIRKHSD